VVEARGVEATDDDLLAQIGAGSRAAFTTLVRRHGERVRGLALAFTARAADADDITQDVFVQLWRSPRAWKPGKAAFSTWLHRVVANRCLDHARWQRLRQWLPIADVPEVADDAPAGVEAVSGLERLATVRRLLRALPPRQRLALVLATQEPRSTAEIAHILGVSEGAAEQLLVRARRALRAGLGE